MRAQWASRRLGWSCYKQAGCYCIAACRPVWPSVQPGPALVTLDCISHSGRQIVFGLPARVLSTDYPWRETRKRRDGGISRRPSLAQTLPMSAKFGVEFSRGQLRPHGLIRKSEKILLVSDAQFHSFKITFNRAGCHKDHCSVHCNGSMEGLTSFLNGPETDVER